MLLYETHPFPNCPNVPCIDHPKGGCSCSSTERALRAWAYQHYRVPMNHAQREWCVKEYLAAWKLTKNPGVPLDEIPLLTRYELRGFSDCLLAGAVVIAYIEYDYAKRHR